MVHRDTAAPVPTSPRSPDDQGSPEDTLVGRTLPGGLRVLHRLGSTPDGMLYQGKYLTGIEVVLLILHPQTAGAKAFRRKRLEQATQIQHLNVAATFEVGEMADGSLYVVLEQLVGEPLSNLLSAGRTFAPKEALDLALQVAAGLRAAQQAGFVHGNVSPHSILVTRAAYGQTQVKIINFALDPTPAIPGKASAKYASPERLDGHPPDELSDVFSLGAVFHHLLTGMPPNPGNVDSSIPKFARSVLGTALAPTPARRFQTVSELEAALARLVVAGKSKKPGIGRVLLLGVVSSGLAIMAAGILLFPSLKWPAASEEPPLPVAGTTKLERAAPNSPTTSEVPSAPAQARSEAPAPSAGQDVPPTRYSPTDNARSPAVANADEAQRAAHPRSVPTAVADTDLSIDTGMVATPPSEPPQPPSFEERAQVYLRIGLDEARQQLGGPVHAMEGMTALFLGLARSRFPTYTDTTRPVVRSVYIGPNGDLILLDQQRVRPGERVPAVTATSWRIGDVMLYLHGEARPEVLRNLVTRVR